MRAGEGRAKDWRGKMRRLEEKEERNFGQQIVPNRKDQKNNRIGKVLLTRNVDRFMLVTREQVARLCWRVGSRASIAEEQASKRVYLQFDIRR